MASIAFTLWPNSKSRNQVALAREQTESKKNGLTDPFSLVYALQPPRAYAPRLPHPSVPQIP